MSIPRILIFIAIAITWSSCRYNTSVMLRTKGDYVYDQLDPRDTTMLRYKLSPNDILNLRIYSNDGFKLIDLTSVNTDIRQNLALTSGLNYIIEQDGSVKLPILGRVQVSGLTLREAEVMLEGLYSKSYNSPFVLLDVNNRRVIVFPGARGDAQVLNIDNNTTLIQALAMAGGISENGKARKIKLIRRDSLLAEPKVFLINLATIDGLEYANVVLQANDIIYVEPKLTSSREVIRDVASYLGILTSAFFLYQISKNL